MKSELENIITSNRAEFDTESPGEGHLERFSMRLSEASAKKSARKRKLYHSGIVRVAGLAASVILILMLINPLAEMPEEFDPQLIEAADYFAHELRSKAEEVKALADFIEPAHRREIIEDIEQLSDLSLEIIPHRGIISQEEKIGLLYEYYQAKSSSLEMIENSITNITGPAAD